MSEKRGGIHFVKTTIIGGLQEHDTHKLHPVLVSFNSAARIGLEIEQLDDGRIVVMTPSSPNPWSGMVHIVEADRVQRLELPITAYMENVERFGQGTNELLKPGIGDAHCDRSRLDSPW